MPKTIIHTATGEFRDEQGRFLFESGSQGWQEAGCPPSPDPAFSLITVPEGVVPDPRTQKWGGAAIVEKTVAEIAAYDATQKDAQAGGIDADAALQAVAQLDFEERQKLQLKNGQTLRTAAQCKARLREIYRSLL